VHLVLDGGHLPTSNIFFNVGYLGVLLALIIAPLLAFSPALLKTWRRGTIEYGALAKQIGDAFEGKWFGNDRRLDQSALEMPDFSSTADLYSVAANADAIRFMPVDLKDLLAIVAALLLPFVPVVLLAIPLDVVWSGIKKLMF
jgi:hypothetical protein